MALSKGCTIGLIIIGVLVVIIIIGAILLWIYKDQIMEAGTGYLIDNTETEILKDIPEGYTEESIHQIMTDLKAAIANGELNDREVQELAGTFQNIMADKGIDREESAELLMTIQEVLGQEPIIPDEIPDEMPIDSMPAVPDSA